MTELGSVNTGTAHDEQWNHPTVRTDIWKPPQPGPRMARRPDLDGDGQSDTAGDDGGQRAILPYQREPHNYWAGVPGRDELWLAEFGENVTVEGLPDTEVCNGDRYRIREAEFGEATADEVTGTGVTAERLTAPAPGRLGVSADAAKYGCGRAPFMAEVHGPLTAFGLPSGRIRAETFGVLTAIPAGVTGGRRVPPHLPRGRVETASWSPSPAAVSPCPSIRRARHYPRWPRPGTSRAAGPAAPSCWPDRPATPPSRSNCSLKARCSSAVPGRRAAWSSTCEGVASEARLRRDQQAHA